MEYIKSWLKTILYMNVLLLICDNLMQKTAYEKYYRFLDFACSVSVKTCH